MIDSSAPNADHGPHYAAGATALAAGDPAQARAAFEAHVAARPDHALGWFALGSARFFCRDWAGAHAAYGRAAALDANYTLGLLLHEGDIPGPVAGDSWRAALPPCTLAIPPRGERPTLVIGCDGPFFLDFGAAFVMSAARACPEWAVHVHVGAPTAAAVDMMERLSLGAAAPLALSFSYEFLPDWLTSPRALRTYLACMRFARLPTLLAAMDSPAPVVVMDADTLLLRPLLPPDHWRPAPPDAHQGWRGGWDVCVKDAGMFPLGPLWRYTAEVVGLAPTPRARAFADDLAGLVARQACAEGGRGLSWMADQYALAVALAAAEARTDGFTLGHWPDSLYRPHIADPALAVLSFTGHEKYQSSFYARLVDDLMAPLRAGT